MLARPLSVAFVGTLALGAAVLFGMSGCDQLEDFAREIIEETKGTGGTSGGTGGTSGGNGGSAGGVGSVGCASSESCPSGQICTTEQGACEAPPGCRGTTSTLVACPAVCYGVCKPKDLVPPPKGEPCGKNTCAVGEICCNDSCGICTPPGAGCVTVDCHDDPPPPKGEACGKNTCAVGETCCNASCGICVAPGGGCTKQLCVDPVPPKGEACGKNTCAVGEVCCNASCGICTPPNGGCILLACTDELPPGSCATDADCHLEADYCTGCDCRALGPRRRSRSAAGPACSASPMRACRRRPCARAASAPWPPSASRQPLR